MKSSERMLASTGDAIHGVHGSVMVAGAGGGGHDAAASARAEARDETWREGTRATAPVSIALVSDAERDTVDG